MRDQINDRFNEFTDSLDEQFRRAGETFSENVTTPATETADRVLDAVLDVNRRAVDFAVTTADRVQEYTGDLPMADRLPTPAETGERYLDFVERAVQLNRDFNQRVASMIETPAVAPKPAAKRPTATAGAKTSTKKASTKKTGARKTSAKNTSTKASTTA
ncbi:MAG: hypothetical protein AAGA42_19890 [Actinomycetota bacterium]